MEGKTAIKPVSTQSAPMHRPGLAVILHPARISAHCKSQDRYIQTLDAVQDRLEIFKGGRMLDTLNTPDSAHTVAEVNSTQAIT